MNELSVRKNFKIWAKMGYIARGAVYLTIGTLALLAAFGLGGGTTDSKGAISNIRTLPAGDILLTILAIGLFGYVIWRFMQGFKDADSHGGSFKALIVRSALVISGIAHATLAIWVIRLLLEDTSSSGNNSSLWQSEMGLWLFGVIGMVFVGVGFAHIYKGWTARFNKYMAIPSSQRSWIEPVCQFGLIARGVVWCVVGWIIISSALMARPNEIQNTADALSWLSSTPFGNIVLGVIAAGLVAFGLYSLLEANYRRINAQV